MATTKKVTAVRKAYYRRAQFVKKSAQSLQQLLSQALNSQITIGSRLEGVGSMANEFRCIAGWKTQGKFLCGHMVTFERGSFQTVIADDPKAKMLKLAALAPPKTTGNVQQQYVPGLLYFIIHKNHVVVLQASALRASALEQHIIWLLRDRTEIITSEQGIGLSDEPQKATRERIRKAHVKSVMIGRPLMESIGLQQSTKGTAIQQFKPEGAVLSFLKEMLDPNQFEKLGLEEGLFEGNLEVWLQIRHPKRARVKPADAVRLLDDLSIALRDLDDDEAKLQLNDGSIVTGKELKISGDIEIETDPSQKHGMLKEQDAYDKMIDWLERQLANGVIAPD